MTRILLLLALVLLVACSAPSPQTSWRGELSTPTLHASMVTPGLGASWQDEEEDEDSAGPVGIAWGILMYIPNRIFDVLDIVRARVRIGPGFAIGARVTEYADVFLGSYASVYVGLPGPRGRMIPRLPVGLESKSGAELSVADVTLEAGLGPDYGIAESGFGLQLGLIGFDIGVDVVEIFDLVVGLFTFDPMDDDF
jgi:hypothetical protein